MPKTKRVIRRLGFGETLVVEIPKGGQVTITPVGSRGNQVNLGVEIPEDAEVRATKLDPPRVDGVLS